MENFRGKDPYNSKSWKQNTSLWVCKNRKPHSTPHATLHGREMFTWSARALVSYLGSPCVDDRRCDEATQCFPWQQRTMQMGYWEAAGRCESYITSEKSQTLVRVHSPNGTWIGWVELKRRPGCLNRYHWGLSLITTNSGPLALPEDARKTSRTILV